MSFLLLSTCSASGPYLLQAELSPMGSRPFPGNAVNRAYSHAPLLSRLPHTVCVIAGLCKAHSHCLVPGSPLLIVIRCPPSPPPFLPPFTPLPLASLQRISYPFLILFWPDRIFPHPHIQPIATLLSPSGILKTRTQSSALTHTRQPPLCCRLTSSVSHCYFIISRSSFSFLVLASRFSLFPRI